MKLKLLALAGLATAALAVPASAGATTLIGSGSTAAQPYLVSLFKGYTKVHPSIHFVYTPDGGNAGVKDVQQGKSQFAAQARAPLPSDAGTTYIKLFLDGLCMDVNSSNKLSNLSIQQVRDIYLGNLTSWAGVPGSGLTSTIDPFGRDTNGGTYNFFVTSVLNNKPPASTVTALLSDGLVANSVKKDPNAIGYNGLAYFPEKGLKALKLNGVPCNALAVKKLRYPLTRYIWLVLPTANSSTKVEQFADWVRTSAAAGKIISKVGGVPAFNQTAKKHKKKKK
ncbi:MAG TPA: substrate-binding domain-containing protein [Thermoleophilaceae bacterium]|jgi:phosphate transport system substrate-binding protein